MRACVFSVLFFHVFSNVIRYSKMEILFFRFVLQSEVSCIFNLARAENKTYQRQS